MDNTVSQNGSGPQQVGLPQQQGPQSSAGNQAQSSQESSIRDVALGSLATQPSRIETSPCPRPHQFRAAEKIFCHQQFRTQITQQDRQTLIGRFKRNQPAYLIAPAADEADKFVVEAVRADGTLSMGNRAQFRVTRGGIYQVGSRYYDTLDDAIGECLQRANGPRESCRRIQVWSKAKALPNSMRGQILVGMDEGTALYLLQKEGEFLTICEPNGQYKLLEADQRGVKITPLPIKSSQLNIAREKHRLEILLHSQFRSRIIRPDRKAIVSRFERGQSAYLMRQSAKDADVFIVEAVRADGQLSSSRIRVTSHGYRVGDDEYDNLDLALKKCLQEMIRDRENATSINAWSNARAVPRSLRGQIILGMDEQRALNLLQTEGEFVTICEPNGKYKRLEMDRHGGVLITPFRVGNTSESLDPVLAEKRVDILFHPRFRNQVEKGEIHALARRFQRGQSAYLIRSSSYSPDAFIIEAVRADGRLACGYQSRIKVTPEGYRVGKHLFDKLDDAIAACLKTANGSREVSEPIPSWCQAKAVPDFLQGQILTGMDEAMALSLLKQEGEFVTICEPSGEYKRLV